MALIVNSGAAPALASPRGFRSPAVVQLHVGTYFSIVLPILAHRITVTCLQSDVALTWTLLDLRCTDTTFCFYNFYVRPALPIPAL